MIRVYDYVQFSKKPTRLGLVTAQDEVTKKFTVSLPRADGTFSGTHHQEFDELDLRFAGDHTGTFVYGSSRR